MSRSRRRTPITGITCAESDKQDKVIAHKQERVAVRSAMVNEDEMPTEKDFGNPWKSSKDGKTYQGPLADNDPLMRK